MLLCNLPILNTTAITGEIDLNANVLQVGGLESKIDGGKSAGVTYIVLKRIRLIYKKIRKRNNPKSSKFKVEMIETLYEAHKRFLIMLKELQYLNILENLKCFFIVFVIITKHVRYYIT